MHLPDFPRFLHVELRGEIIPPGGRNGNLTALLVCALREPPNVTLDSLPIQLSVN